MNKFLIFAVALLGCMGSFSACNSDDDDHEHNDQELITTLSLHFEDTLSGTTQTFTFRDLDGPGGNNPVVDAISLAPNRVYDLTLDILDESKTPAESITEEIEEENLAHIFLFYALNGLDLTTSYLDQDGNGLPLGLSNRVVTGQAGTGKFQVVLKHESDKNNAATTGETDIDVSFDAKIE